LEDPLEKQESVNLTSLGTQTLHPWGANDKVEHVESHQIQHETVAAEEEKLEDKSNEEETKENKQLSVFAIGSDEVEIMSANNRKETYRNTNFIQFFDRSSLLVERILSVNKGFDVFADFSRDQPNQHELEQAADIKFKRKFEDKETDSRSVTCINWSKQAPELFLACYAFLEESYDTPQGLLVVWNVLLDNRAEYKFIYQSRVTCAAFHPTNGKHVIGCTISGQVLVWDMRENKRTPIFRSPISSGLAQTIFAMDFLSSTNSSEPLITVSHGAHICVYRDEEISDPDETEFKIEQSASHDDFVTTCFSVPVRDTHTIMLGSDNGKLYAGTVFSAEQSQECQEIEAHNGPVTNIEFHPGPKGIHSIATEVWSRLYLTSSYDWTISLWQFRDQKKQLKLLTIDLMQDYVTDVKWSPVHPAIFAAVDGTGCVNIFNLIDTNQPLVTKKITDSAITTINWSEDGKIMLFGDSSGVLHTYEVSEEMITCSEENAVAFENSVNKLIKSALNADPAEKQLIS